VGDAAYTLRNVHEQRLPLLAADRAAAARSLREIADLTDVTLVPSHDPTAWEDLLP
jgi:glyoxylase-like metal-dependent hydrolase (beta-lactamase superfamily II)